MLKPLFKQDDKKANMVIWVVSIVICGAVAFLTSFKPLTWVDLGFNVHLLALANAIINGTVSVLLILAFAAVKMKKSELHRTLMLIAIALSVLFLVTYIGHHLFAKETKYEGVGFMRYLYLFILITHIALATIILPFILFTAYRSLSGEYKKHKKLARYTWPLWLYVSVTGVLVYWLISPYYVPHL